MGSIDEINQNFSFYRDAVLEEMGHLDLDATEVETMAMKLLESMKDA